MLILQVTKHGLILDFLSSFSGQVDFLHMEPEQASSYKEGSEVKLAHGCFLHCMRQHIALCLSLFRLSNLFTVTNILD